MSFLINVIENIMIWFAIIFVVTKFYQWKDKNKRIDHCGAKWPLDCTCKNEDGSFKYDDFGNLNEVKNA